MISNDDEPLLADQPGLSDAEFQALLLACKENGLTADDITQEEPAPDAIGLPTVPTTPTPPPHDPILRHLGDLEKAPVGLRITSEGLYSADLAVLDMAMRGYMAHEIAGALALTSTQVRSILQKAENKTFLQGVRQNVDTALDALSLEMVTRLRGLLNSPDPRIQIQAVREVAKLNGLYQDETVQRTGAEDVVRDVLALARDSLHMAAGRTAPTNVSRFLNGTAERVTDDG